MPQVTLIYYGMNCAPDSFTINRIMESNKVYIACESGRDLIADLIGNSAGTGNSGGLEQAIIDFVHAKGNPSRVGPGSDYGVAERALGHFHLALKATLRTFYIGRDVVAQK